MKSFLKKFVLWVLKRLAKKRIRKFKGKIIIVSGTVGKTSTKDAIFSVLNSRFKVLRTHGNQNNEFGLPLTILEIESGQSSALKWSWLLLKAFFNSIGKNHNEVLLLEYAVDKPKDMDYLLSIAKPNIAVLTNITPEHLDEGQFADLQEIFTEKRKIVDALRDEGIAILNGDNPYIETLAKERKKKNTITYGLEREATYRAIGLSQDASGLDFTVERESRRYKIHANVLGEFQVYVILPAIICAELMGMEMEEIITALLRYTLPPGRLTVIPAINNAIILDSSYNSSPESLKRALQTLNAAGGGKRRIAALGSMNELGEKSREMHEIIGKEIPKYADVLITVGNEAKYFAEQAAAGGMNPENISSFKTSTEAADFLKDKIDGSDLILVKGSQNNIRMERLVKALMEHPEDAKKLLVRQEKEWELKI